MYTALPYPRVPVGQGEVARRKDVNGFWYQHFNPVNFLDWTTGGYGNHVRFPEDLWVAKEFVEAYRTHKGKNL